MGGQLQSYNAELIINSSRCAPLFTSAHAGRRRPPPPSDCKTVNAFRRIKKRKQIRCIHLNVLWEAQAFCTPNYREHLAGQWCKYLILDLRGSQSNGSQFDWWWIKGEEIGGKNVTCGTYPPRGMRLDPSINSTNVHKGLVMCGINTGYIPRLKRFTCTWW